MPKDTNGVTKAKTGRLNFHCPGLSYTNDEGIKTIEVGEIHVRDLSPSSASIQLIELLEGMTTLAKKQIEG